MGVYLGIIEHNSSGQSLYYNYKPIYELRGGVWVQLTQEDKSELLPESRIQNINFYYNRNIQKQYDNMKVSFPDRTLIVFEFEPGDLEDNKRPYSEQWHHTRYKVSAEEMKSRGKIRSLDFDGFYPLIRKDEINTEFQLNSIVELRAAGINEGNRVLLDYNGFFAGPFTVRRMEKYWATNESYYVDLKIKENKYIVRGYKKENCFYQEIFLGGRTSAEESRFVVAPAADAETDVIDAISDMALLDSFRENISSEFIDDGKIDISNIETLLLNYESSMLQGKELSGEIRKNRLYRLGEILTSEADIEQTLRYMTDSFLKILLKYRSSPGVNEFIENICRIHPDLFDQMKSTRIIKERIADLQQKQDALRQQNLELEQEITTNWERARSEEAKERELTKLDERYLSKKAELDVVISELEVAGNIGELNRRLDEVKSEIAYHESHCSRLKNDTRNLESEFSERINNYHDKMVGISFDGWMSNKMIQSASQWEMEESQQDYYRTVKGVNSISAFDMTPCQLIEYLLETVRSVRPQYDRNTIINIAICMSQGFLTVFSGEPGSGKTSICNIMADALGLNKISRLAWKTGAGELDANRFISVSVERGWTSKRDFIGYYNPLSKTFDKSNRRIYDALKMLDIEKSTYQHNFPFIILLDEANLSPMEYYWADFMKACDDLENNAKINLGEDNIFSIPETLHFVATINNDHTTEQLSPRLIDRAWIITLPYNTALADSRPIDADKVKPVTWRSIKRAFHSELNSVFKLPAEANRIYELVLSHLRKQRILVSHRTDLVIRRYLSVASRHFENREYEGDASIIALDYAIAQKILPRINGNGEEFAKWLDEFRGIIGNNNMVISARILKDIIARGNDQMKYYQFF